MICSYVVSFIVLKHDGKASKARKTFGNDILRFSPNSFNIISMTRYLCYAQYYHLSSLSGNWIHEQASEDVQLLWWRSSHQSLRRQPRRSVRVGRRVSSPSLHPLKNISVFEIFRRKHHLPDRKVSWRMWTPEAPEQNKVVTTTRQNQ